MQAPDAITATLPRYAEWLTTDDVADQLGVSSVVVNAWIVNGIKTETGRIRLQAAKVGGRWKIDPTAVVEFVTASTAASLPTSATAPASVVPPVKPDTESGLKRRGEACMARLKARGWSSAVATSQHRKRSTQS